MPDQQRPERRLTDAPPPSRTLAHLLVVGLVAFAAVSGIATASASSGSSNGGLAFGLVDLARGADGDAFTSASAQYELVPDPENPGIQIVRGVKAPVPDPTPLPTPVAPPKVVKTVTTLKIVGNGQLLWPVTGGIITTYFSASHPAIDIAVPAGRPVFAADAGTVIWSGWKDGGGGLQIEIDHGNGLVTRYAHLSVALWVVGDVVTRGQQIGEVGCTGTCTGPHVHFDVMVNGVHVNPLRYL